MRLHQSTALQRFVTDNGTCSGRRPRHRDVVADTGAGNRFLIPVGVHENVRRCAEHSGAQFHRQRIVKQHHHLCRLGDGEATVGCKRAAGAAKIRYLIGAEAIELAQAFLRRQRAHGGITLHNFRGHRCFGGTDKCDPRTTAANIVDTVAQVVQE